MPGNSYGSAAPSTVSWPDVRAKGIEREVSLFLLQDDPVAIGDFVLVHVGYAIQKMTPQQARSAWELFDEVLAAEGADSRA